MTIRSEICTRAPVWSSKTRFEPQSPYSAKQFVSRSFPQATCAPFFHPFLGRIRPILGAGQMRQSRFSEEQIIGLLKEQEADEPLCIACFQQFMDRCRCGIVVGVIWFGLSLYSITILAILSLFDDRNVPVCFGVRSIAGNGRLFKLPKLAQ